MKQRTPLLLLGAAVVVGCIGLGAPPRMESVEGATTWARVALESLAPQSLVMLLVFAAFVLHATRSSAAAADGASRVARPLTLVLLLGLISLFPLSWGFVAETQEALSGDDLPLRAHGTLWPDGTITALFLWFAVFVATVVVRRVDRAFAPRLLGFVALLAAAQCVHGIVTTHLGDDSILGLDKVSSNGRVTGTFVMPSLLGALAVMGACCALALAVRAGNRRKLAALAWFVVVAVCAAGCALTLSRWMVAALVVGLAITSWLLGGALLRGSRRLAGNGLRGAALLVPVAGVAAALTIPSLRARFEFLLPYLRGQPGPVEPRFAGWVSTWDLFLEAPLLGTGLGSFARAVHLTQSVDAPQELWYAHCQPLNLLADAGIVGFALVGWWLVASWWAARPALSGDGIDGADVLLACGAAGAATGALVTGLADFPTQFPVIAIPMAALLALPGTLGARRDRANDTGTPRRSTLERLVPVAVVTILLVRGGIDAVERTAHAIEGRAPGATRGERLLVDGRAELASLADAATPVEAYERAESAAELLREAALEEPVHDATHLWRGLAHVTLLQLTSDPDLADLHRATALRSFGRARRVSRGHADVNLQIGVLYLDLLGTEPNPHGPPGDTAMAALREAGALVPQAFSRAWKEGRARELPPEALEQLVPDREHARRVWDAYARSLSSDPRSGR